MALMGAPQARGGLGAALAGLAVVVLTACTPPENSPGEVVGGCDPAGFGPLSGCSDQDSNGADLDSAPADDPADPPSACPPEYGATVGEDGEIDFANEGTYNVEPGSACEAQIEQDSRELTAGFLDAVERELTNPTPRDWTVRDTHPLPAGQCLVGLDEIGSEHFSRRPMPGDCDRYPAGSRQHTGGGTP